MKLLRYGPVGQEKPGLLDAEGTLRDLSGLIDDITPRRLAPEALAALVAVDPARLPAVPGNPRLGVPWNGTPKYVAIGLNYHDHAVESNMPVPVEPVIFPKWTSCLCGANDDIIHPPESTQMDWEVELGIVIGSRARKVSEAEALDHVAGYVLASKRQPAEKAMTWVLAGLAALWLGQVLDAWLMPINKSLWTPSFTFTMAGWACLVFAVFYWLLDASPQPLSRAR